MNAQEIINELKAGKTVAILSDDAFEFMREVERHNIPCEGIAMSFSDGQCVMSIAPQNRPEHDWQWYDRNLRATGYTDLANRMLAEFKPDVARVAAALSEDRCMFCGGKTAHEPDCSHGRIENTEQWIVHIVGPDDVIQKADELDALRSANAVNIEIERERRRHANDPNYPFAIALAKERE